MTTACSKKNFRPIIRRTDKKKYPSAKYFYLLSIVVFSSIGVLFCVLFISWITLDTGIGSSKYTYYHPLDNINTAGMKGTITLADSGNPLKNGIISISYRYAIVNETGNYNILPIKPGTYDFKFTFRNQLLLENKISLIKGPNVYNFSINRIIPDLMVRSIPEGTPEKKMFIHIPPGAYTRGNPDLRRVAITIDDGWFEHNELLDLFKSYGIRCTVFIIGGKGIGDARPHWIKKMDDMGFEVCNHTYDHTDITKLNNKELTENIRKAQKNITKVTHKIYPYFRPPFGTYDKRTLKVVADNGFKIILWTISINDTYWGVKPSYQISHVLKNLQNGDIILCHFRAYNTYAVIKELIPKILDRGFKIVTISEVLEGL